MRAIILLVSITLFFGSCSEEKPKKEATSEKAEELAPMANREFSKTNLRIEVEEGMPELGTLEKCDEYLLDIDRSFLIWVGAKVFGENHRGKILLNEGRMLVGEFEQYQAKVIADMNTLTVEDIQEETKNTKLLNHLRNTDFFNVDEFPKASVILMGLSREGENENMYGGEIMLRIKDKVHPTIVRCALNESGDSLIANGNFVFDRTMYDITYRSDNYFKNLGEKAISDNVEVEFQMIFYKN